jgi:hypothetical protein
MARQKSLETEDGEILKPAPKKVQDAADAYASALRKLGNGKAKLNTAKDVLIDEMKKADCKTVEIDEGHKRIVLSEKDTLKIKKVKSPDGVADDDEDEE